MKITPVVIALGAMIATPIIVTNVTIPDSVSAQVAKTQASPIKIQRHSEYLTMNGIRVEDSIIEILSTVDSVEVQSITLNRGNCKAYDRRTRFFGDNRPEIIPLDKDKSIVTLKYGETKKLSTDCQTLLSADIKTDLGEWSYTFKD
jgi:hypothetical protein